MLVTGSTDGIGRETALELARLGARVVVHGRNATRVSEAHAAVARVSEVEPPEPVVADFASFAAVHELVSALDSRGVVLDALVNNAGVYMKRRELSADGVEMTLAVNHFAHVLLTHLLLAGPSGQRLSRVVNVSSVAHPAVTRRRSPRRLSMIKPVRRPPGHRLVNLETTVGEYDGAVARTAPRH